MERVRGKLLTPGQCPTFLLRPSSDTGDLLNPISRDRVWILQKGGAGEPDFYISQLCVLKFHSNVPTRALVISLSRILEEVLWDGG